MPSHTSPPWRSEICASFHESWQRSRGFGAASSAGFDPSTLGGVLRHFVIVGGRLEEAELRFRLEFLHPSVERGLSAPILGTDVTSWIDPILREAAYRGLKRAISDFRGIRLLAPLTLGNGPCWIETILLPLSLGVGGIRMVGVFESVRLLPQELAKHAYGIELPDQITFLELDL